MQKFYYKNGYILIKNIFNNHEIDECLKEIKKIFENLTGEKFNDNSLFNLYRKDHEKYLSGCKACHNLISVYNLMLHKNVINIIKILGIEFPSINMKPVIMFSSKNLASHNFYWKTNPHQDFSGMKGSLDGIVLWTPLFNMEKEHGFIEIIPKSHKNGFLKHEETGPTFEICEKLDENLFIPIETNKGDALLFSAFTIHRSGENNSNQIRFATNFRYDNLNENNFIKKNYPQSFNLSRNNKHNCIDNAEIYKFWQNKTN